MHKRAPRLLVFVAQASGIDELDPTETFIRQENLDAADEGSASIASLWEGSLPC